MTFKLNEQQETVVEKLSNFILEPPKNLTVSFEQNIRILQGFAGVGKTTVITTALSEIVKTFTLKAELFDLPEFNRPIYFCAPSHKAAGVIKTMIKSTPFAQNTSVSTLHSLLALRIRWDAETGKQVNFPDTRPRVLNKIKQDIQEAIIFVDESSMVEKDHIERLKALSSPKTKIILIGDKDQLLNMAGQNFFSFWINKYPSLVWELTKPQRNSGYINELAHEYRKAIMSGQFPAYIDDSPNTGVKFIDFSEDIVETYLDKHRQGENVKVIAWHRQCVEQHNTAIKIALNGGKGWKVGDPLLAQSPLLSKVNNAETIISNNQEVTITEILGKPEVLRVMDGVSDDFETFSVVPVRIANNTVAVYLPENSLEYHHKLKQLQRQRKIGILQQLERTIFNATANHATTVHKSQGSTYDTVILDIGDIGQSNRPNDFARMMYVALLRAKTNVYLFGDLPDKYIGE